MYKENTRQSLAIHRSSALNTSYTKEKSFTSNVSNERFKKGSVLYDFTDTAKVFTTAGNARVHPVVFFEVAAEE